MVPLRVHGNIYGQIIGGAGPPVALLGGPVALPAPLVPTPLVLLLHKNI